MSEGLNILKGLLGLRPTFDGGVHPPTFKEMTKDLAIRQFPFASVMNLPLSQHIGNPSVPLISQGRAGSRTRAVAG